MPSFEEIASWVERYKVPEEVATCCMLGLLTSLTRLPDGTPGPWCAELTRLDERDVEGEDVSTETTALCRSIVETVPWLQPHILKYAGKIPGNWELFDDTFYDDDVFNIETVLDEIASNLLSLESVRSIELVNNPQPDGLDYLLRLTPSQGEVMRIGLYTSFTEGEQEGFDDALQSAAKSARSFDKQMWFGG